MKISQLVRNRMFWGMDLLGGGKIRKQVREIRESVENYTSCRSAARRADLLGALLTHATETTPFYRPFLGSRSIEDFPVINKNMIRNESPAFRSRRFPGRLCKEIMTSGSTGTPLTIVQDRAKAVRNTADTIYFAERAGFRVGHRLYYIRLWNEHMYKSRLQARLQNVRMVQVLDLCESYWAKLIRNWQEDHSVKGLIGYVSGFTQLCRYLDSIGSGPLNCNVSSIIAVAEHLSAYCRQSMEKYLGAPVVSRYSNSENGILAQQPLHGSDFVVNWASYHVEIFDLDEDRPVGFGETGRIVITDLFNYAMPLIRYDTGDVGCIELDRNGVPVLKKIEGRKMDMLYDTRGRMLSPSVVWQLENYENIRQFQVVQRSAREYTIRLNVAGNLESQAAIINEFRGYFGEDAVIDIDQTTDEIPVLASGKRRLVVNNFFRG